MIDHDFDPASSTRQAGDPEEIVVAPALGALTELITRRLESGELVDADDYAQRFPEWADSVQTMLPVIRELVELSRSVARTRQAPISDPGCPVADLRRDVSH